MTPASLIHKIWYTRTGASMLLLIAMLCVAVLIYAIFMNTANTTDVVEYGSSRYTPSEATYCPGDTMIYTVTLDINPYSLPVTHVVDEDWKDSRGMTIRYTQNTQRIPLTEPVYYEGPAVRVVPDFLKPGTYWLDHVSQNGTSTGYRVGPVNVVNCNN